MTTYPIRYTGHSHEEPDAPVEAGATYMPSILLTVLGSVVTGTAALAVYSSDDVVKIVAAVAGAGVALIGALGLWAVRILNAMNANHAETVKLVETKQAETIGAMKQKVAEAIKESPIATTPEEKELERKAQALVTKEVLDKPDIGP